MANRYNLVEVFIGFLVVTVSIAFFVHFTSVYNSNTFDDKYKNILFMKFRNVSGLKKGSKVSISGIDVGVVDKLELDYEQFYAKVTIKMNEDVKVPLDSEASILSDGFLGNKFINIVPGSSDIHLKNQESINYTQSSISLEELLYKFMGQFAEERKK